MATTKEKTTTTGTKAQRAIAMKEADPNIRNSEIASRIGMAPAYVSQILSKHRNGGTTTSTKKKTRKTRQTQTQVTRTAAKTAISAGSAIMRATDETGKMVNLTWALDARSTLACMVSRLGSCAVQDLLADVTKT